MRCFLFELRTEHITSPQTSERLIMDYYNTVPLPVHSLTKDEEMCFTSFLNNIENALICRDLEDLGKKDKKQMETVEKLVKIDNEMRHLLTKIDLLTRSDDYEKADTDDYEEFLASLKKSPQDSIAPLCVQHIQGNQPWTHQFYPEITKFPQEHPGQCFPQMQHQQMLPETPENVSLGELRNGKGFVLFCFGNTKYPDKILQVLDNFFTVPHFSNGEIGVYRSLQNANILYLVIPIGRKNWTKQLKNKSFSFKDKPRENGEKWPLIANLNSGADLSQMTIPLN